MTSLEIYNDISQKVQPIIQRSGANAICVGLVTDVSHLPRRKAHLHVWYSVSANEATLILKEVILNFGIQAKNITGQYLYAYEIENHLPQIQQ